jgi:ribosomal protein L40E
MPLAICPRCNSILARADRAQRCPKCGGTFLRPAQPENPVEEGAAVPAQRVSTLSPDTGAAHVGCPNCLTRMEPQEGRLRFRCSACGGSWQDGDEYLLTETAAAAASTELPLPGDSHEAGLSEFTTSLLYGASLPERLLRSGIGLTAGAVKEIAGLVIPQAFQSAKSYEIAIDKSLTFLTETIGGVRSPTGSADQAAEHIARKAVGNFVDLAGLATLHVSPMWVLAAVSDIAYGGKTYVREVADELKRQGVIDDTAVIHHIDDILDAIQRSSGNVASTLDSPPLSVEELRQSLERTREDLRGADLRRLLPEAEVRRLWMEMEMVASQENVSLLEVSSTMTMRMLDQMQTVSSGALTGIRVAGGLLNRTVLQHYTDSLARIRERGFYATVAESYHPYVHAVWYNFAGDRQTLTEQLLNPNTIRKAVDKLFGFLERKSDPRPPAN